MVFPKRSYIKELIQQSDYDINTARNMFKTKSYIYCVFMCHLSLEKMLKALHIQNLGVIAPKTHFLSYLTKAQNLELQEDEKTLIEDLDKAGIPTRYPEKIKIMLKTYNASITKEILIKTIEVLKCLKKKLEK